VETYFTEKGFKILNALDVVAKEYNSGPAEIALAWLRAQPGIVAPIASATNSTQLKSLMKSVSIKLDPRVIELLTKLQINTPGARGPVENLFAGRSESTRAMLFGRPARSTSSGLWPRFTR